MLYENKTITKARLTIDHNEFKSCKLHGCELVYHGETPIAFKDCDLIDCKWIYAGAAARGLALLSLFYSQESTRPIAEAFWECVVTGTSTMIELPGPITQH